MQDEQVRIRQDFEAQKRETRNVEEPNWDRLLEEIKRGPERSEETEAMVLNMQSRMTLMQMEKDSVTQLWQMALKSIDVLEQELESYKCNGKSAIVYEQQVNGIKGTYSEAIRALEGKLAAAKDNFLKQKVMWESSRDQLANLTAERDKLTARCNSLEKNSEAREKKYEKIVDSLKREISALKSETQDAVRAKIELEKKVAEAKMIVSGTLAKDSEMRHKMCEALELVETAVRERDSAMRRETEISEEKKHLEKMLNDLEKSYRAQLDKEVTLFKDSQRDSMKDYLMECKELKSELRQTATILDRAQREARLLEEELERVRREAENNLQVSNLKIASAEQKMNEANAKYLEVESRRKMSEEKCRLLENRLQQLEENFLKSHKTFESEKCLELERLLAVTQEERDKINNELMCLKSTFELEIRKRDHERTSLERRFDEIKENLRRDSSPLKIDQMEFVEREVKRNQAELVMQLSSLKVKFDMKTKELTQHVEMYRNLSEK